MSEASPTSGRSARWHLLSAVARGASHDRRGLPLQDAATPPAPEGREPPLVLAVADGHGDRLHSRSGRGAAFAVQVAGEAGAALGEALGAAAGAAEAEESLRSLLVPRLVERWREEVLADLAEEPPEPGEAVASGKMDPAVAYGTTLVAALVAGDWLGLCQIGDGDAVVVGADGTADAPVPRDPRLDGLRTTSLCQPDAADAFRVAARDLRRHPVAAVMLATDGFGNAQSEARWQAPVAEDILRMAREHGAPWVRRQLPGWVARCASSEGSGDDVSVVLALAAEGLRSGVPGGGGP